MEGIEEIIKEQKNTNRLLEKLIGLLQSQMEPDRNYQSQIIKDGIKIPK